jgi:hypothetical protein
MDARNAVLPTAQHKEVLDTPAKVTTVGAAALRSTVVKRYVRNLIPELVEDTNRLTLFRAVSVSSSTKKGKGVKASAVLVPGWRTRVAGAHSSQGTARPKGKSKKVIKDGPDSPPPEATAFEEEESGSSPTATVTTSRWNKVCTSLASFTHAI